MESKTTLRCITLWVFYTLISASTLSPQCEKWKPQNQKSPTDYTGTKNHLNDGQALELYGPQFSQPPLDSISLSPQNSPDDDPPLFCVYPPISQQNPPPPPPNHYGPRPITPKLGPSPPSLPPPPPEHKRPKFAVWCVAKPTVPGPVIQEALDYACGSGANCRPINPDGPCFQPNTVLAHASYAFNDYFQSTKLRGGTCDFGGTAMLVTDDPSFDGCLFLFA